LGLPAAQLAAHQFLGEVASARMVVPAQHPRVSVPGHLLQLVRWENLSQYGRGLVSEVMQAQVDEVGPHWPAPMLPAQGLVLTPRSIPGARESTGHGPGGHRKD